MVPEDAVLSGAFTEPLPAEAKLEVVVTLKQIKQPLALRRSCIRCRRESSNTSNLT